MSALTVGNAGFEQYWQFVLRSVAVHRAEHMRGAVRASYLVAAYGATSVSELVALLNKE